MVLQQLRSADEDTRAEVVSIVKESTMVLQPQLVGGSGPGVNVSIVKESTMVLQRSISPTPTARSSSFNCEGINYGIATPRPRSTPSTRRGFNCEGINYGIATT